MRKLDETLRTYTFGDQISKEFFLILDNGRFVNHDADHPNSGADHPVTGKPFHSKGYTSASGVIVTYIQGLANEEALSTVTLRVVFSFIVYR